MTTQLITELPEIFDSFAQARKNGFLAVKKLKDQGRGVVGTFCTYTPVEIFLAAGLTPVGLCSTSDETIPEAEKILPRNLCPLIKASYGFAAADKCPYMHFSDLVVGETTCDGKKKMYELLGRLKDVHVMQLPQTQTGPAAKALWLAEVFRLKEEVETKFGRKIGDDDLRRAIKERNVERAKHKEFYELSVLSPPPMTGLSQLQFLFGSQFKFDHETKVAEIEQAVAQLKAAYERGERPAPPSAKRLILTGCPMGGATEKVVKALEDSGAVVVAFENCTGAKQFDRQIPEEGDPWTSLAEHYLAIGCAVMAPNPNRLELLERLCRQFAADGVVEMVLTACQPYAVETSALRERLRELGTPFTSLETDYSSSDLELLRNRAAAFVETLS
ncbi:MAG: 2-hydroxyacyl-CoA dehydratase family protein [Deltaproteobacteria bacterium]|jgi:benzoyl-CoA reductase/2-hydroxyglutaryl-CoA dehydratase subunit BcrC/BadD/HgdB|nr:2-hydroxyacyl-CoA dehydratase family protein [Deltaproteobacteria bacterium]